MMPPGAGASARLSSGVGRSAVQALQLRALVLSVATPQTTGYACRRPVHASAPADWTTVRAATADQARYALTAGRSACPHCRPDTLLGVLKWIYPVGCAGV
ncbi:DUF6233 domain-containing protein [Streptomyces sp. PA5.6]|uniref:DUF6233 domain-containing protein n=1 Tax=Streptomyces sp. PA5.6 TaxID=3035651 RepID=UPI0039047503